MLVVVGPTGTGKSLVARRVAEAIGGEIVGCDALQVYRGLDAATAKPDADSRRAVPHRLIDIVDPRNDYSLAEYVQDADLAIAEIVAAGRVPVVVGGTGMYLRGLLKGIVPLPPRDEALRSRLRVIADRHGGARLWRLLSRRDPESAARIAPGDLQRLVRALEVSFSPGPPWSDRLALDGTWEAGAARYRALKFGLDLDRAELARRLAVRVEAFFAAGLVEEVRGLLAAGVPPEANAFKAIGYREVVGALARGEDPESTRGAVVVATRRYAKRQRTWFRSEPGVTWLDASEAPDGLVERIVSDWKRAC